MYFWKSSFALQSDKLECVFKLRSWFSFLELFLSKQTGEGVSSANLKRHQLQDFPGSSAWWVCRLEPEKIRDFSSNAPY